LIWFSDLPEAQVERWVDYAFSRSWRRVGGNSTPLARRPKLQESLARRRGALRVRGSCPGGRVVRRRGGTGRGRRRGLRSGRGGRRRYRLRPGQLQVQRRSGDEQRLSRARDVQPDRRRCEHRRRAPAGRQPVRLRRLSGLPQVIRPVLGPLPGHDPSGRREPRVPDQRRHGLLVGAAGYFKYFGAAAGDSRGDSAWNLGTWHLIALNGNCGKVGGCGSGSPQGNFLKQNLGSATCTLAYWHQPYYNGTSTAASSYKYFWQTLYNAGADVVLAGHLHTYGRFAPQDAAGHVDASRGIRQFIVGTGGDDLFSLNGSRNVEKTSKTFGILKLTLHATSYDWRFVNASGGTVDSGSAACH